MVGPVRRLIELLAGSVQAGWRWSAREAVDAVRYRPGETGLALAGSAATGLAPGIADWLARAHAAGHAQPRRDVAAHRAALETGRAGALMRWYSGAVARATDRLSAQLVHRLLGDPGGPSLLVPHLHEVAVLAADMRGFSRLTSELRDTQYLARLVCEYQTVLTDAVERHHGVVFQYTGDGLLAVFLRELTGLTADAMLERLTTRVLPELHTDFTALYRTWRTEWHGAGVRVSRIGLGTGLSFGWVTLGFMGPESKKHVGVIGEPVNLAAFLCSQAPAGTLLVDRASFRRADGREPIGEVRRLRSKKPHQRIDCLMLRAPRRQPS